MSILDNLAKLEGKWAYVWRPQNMFKGDVGRAIQELKATGTAGIAIKVSNGTYAYDQDPLLDQMIMGCVQENISVIFWSYIYLNSPVLEAKAAIKMCTKYKDVCIAFLIDAEGDAKGKAKQAKLFAAELKKGLDPLEIPIALNSYRYPSLHPELPFTQLRSIGHLDIPQVYYRNTDPISNLERSYREYAALCPKLGYEPAGDMYFEFGVKPTPAAVRRFLEFCRDDPRFDMALMWSADQCECTPDLWAAYATVVWPVEGKPHTTQSGYTPLPPPLEKPLYAAVVIASVLNVRQGNGIAFPILRTLRRGDRCTIYQEASRWCRINPGEWVSHSWIKPL